MLATEVLTAEDSFDRFAAWCATADTCALKGRDVAAVYDALVAARTGTRSRAGSAAPRHRRGHPDADARGCSSRSPGLRARPSWAACRGGSRPPSRAMRRCSRAAADGAAPMAERARDRLHGLRLGVHTWAQMQQRMQLGRGLAPHLQGASEQWASSGASAGRSLRPTPSAGSTSAASPR